MVYRFTTYKRELGYRGYAGGVAFTKEYKRMWNISGFLRVMSGKSMERSTAISKSNQLTELMRTYGKQ